MSDSLFGVHKDALLLRSKQIGLIAENIANANTPGYKAKGISFRNELAGTQGSLSLARTSIGHLDMESSHRVGYVGPTAPSLDGNTVDVELEKVKLAEATRRYAESLEFINGSIKSRLRVIKGD